MQQNPQNETRIDLNKLVRLNNFIFLVFAICTKKVYEKDTCRDKDSEKFLNWVLKGNIVIFAVVLVGLLLSKFKIFENFVEKCGAVCVTI